MSKDVTGYVGDIVRVCKENEMNVLECGRIRLAGENRENTRNVKSTEKVVSGLDYLEELSAKDLSTMCVVWRRLVRRGLLEDNRIYSPEINMGEDVPFSFRVLMSAKRMMVIPDRCYLYRVNPDSLTGTRWKPTPSTLYEKCFVGAKHIYEVAMDVPTYYKNVRNLFMDTARYTLNLYGAFLLEMYTNNRRQFKILCKNSFRENRFIKALFSKRNYANYILWLVGIKPLPK
jgi:hypothetical protein